MVGVDEVGRGSLAGPLLVVAARQTSDLPDGLKDSKLLSRQVREAMFEPLIKACRFGEGWVESVEIDRLGLGRALRLGVRRSLLALEAGSDEVVIVDGSVNFCPKRFCKAKCLVDADALVPIVSAASVYAKVRRDRFMAELAERFPAYGFDKHVGYGTKQHMEALRELGALKNVHRQIYAPVRRLYGADA